MSPCPVRKSSHYAECIHVERDLPRSPKPPLTDERVLPPSDERMLATSHPLRNGELDTSRHQSPIGAIHSLARLTKTHSRSSDGASALRRLANPIPASSVSAAGKAPGNGIVVSMSPAGGAEGYVLPQLAARTARSPTPIVPSPVRSPRHHVPTPPHSAPTIPRSPTPTSVQSRRP